MMSFLIPIIINHILETLHLDKTLTYKIFLISLQIKKEDVI